MLGEELENDTDMTLLLTEDEKIHRLADVVEGHIEPFVGLCGSPINMPFIVD
jgi:hypothetical protein